MFVLVCIDICPRLLSLKGVLVAHNCFGTKQLSTRMLFWLLWPGSTSCPTLPAPVIGQKYSKYSDIPTTIRHIPTMHQATTCTSCHLQYLLWQHATNKWFATWDGFRQFNMHSSISVHDHLETSVWCCHAMGTLTSVDLSTYIQYLQCMRTQDDCNDCGGDRCPSGDMIMLSHWLSPTYVTCHQVTFTADGSDANSANTVYLYYHGIHSVPCFPGKPNIQYFSWLMDSTFACSMCSRTMPLTGQHELIHNTQPGYRLSSVQFKFCFLLLSNSHARHAPEELLFWRPADNPVHLSYQMSPTNPAHPLTARSMLALKPSFIVQLHHPILRQKSTGENSPEPNQLDQPTYWYLLCTHEWMHKAIIHPCQAWTSHGPHTWLLASNAWYCAPYSQLSRSANGNAE